MIQSELYQGIAEISNFKKKIENCDMHDCLVFLMIHGPGMNVSYQKMISYQLIQHDFF